MEDRLHKAKSLVLTGIFIGLLCLSATAQSEQQAIKEEIKLINLEILHLGLKWTAGETSLSYLSKSEKLKRLGSYYPRIGKEEDLLFIEPLSSLPKNIDWRDSGGKNYLTVIKDQGDCGSCWAFSTVGVIEARYNIENGMYSIQPDLASNRDVFPKLTPVIPSILALDYPNLSEQDLISCSTAGDCNGGWESDALIYIKSRGIVSENCFPYEAQDVNCDVCVDWKNKLTKIKRWGWVTGSSGDKITIKTALQDGPLIFYMEVYSDFYNYQSGIYEPVPSAVYEGDHSIILIGYDENDDCWICKNSWGTEWGESGYFKIKFGVCETGTYVLEAGGVTMVNKAPSLDPIPDQNVKEGEELSLLITASDPDGDSLTFSSANLPSGAVLRGSGLIKWTPGYTQSGEYSINIIVNDGSLDDSRDMKVTVINVKQGKGKY